MAKGIGVKKVEQINMKENILVDMTKRKTKFDISLNRCVIFGV